MTFRRYVDGAISVFKLFDETEKNNAEILKNSSISFPDVIITRKLKIFSILLFHEPILSGALTKFKQLIYIGYY